MCVNGDGLKWFNWLYLQGTQTIENLVNAGGFNAPVWLSELDVQFAKLHFTALNGQRRANKRGITHRPSGICETFL
jgi:hypothetical protein